MSSEVSPLEHVTAHATNSTTLKAQNSCRAKMQKTTHYRLYVPAAASNAVLAELQAQSVAVTPSGDTSGLKGGMEIFSISIAVVGLVANGLAIYRALREIKKVHDYNITIVVEATFPSGEKHSVKIDASRPEPAIKMELGNLKLKVEAAEK